MATYYVSSSYTGGTSNGQESTPWKTLSAVSSNMSSFAAGDQILFKKGDTFTGTLTITKSGTAGNPIKFGAYGDGDNPKFTGTGSQITSLFNMFNRSYITFENLWITDPSISPTDRTIQSKIQRGFVIDGTAGAATNVIIKDCKLELVGVGVYMVTGSNTITGCEMGNLRMVRNTNDGPPPGNDDDYGANPVVISSSNNLITKNYFHDCWAQSFDYGVDGGAIDIYADNGNLTGNTITYNTFIDCNGIIEIGGSGGYTVANTTLAYNKMLNNGSICYISNSGTYLTYVNNLKFYNNVIVETEAYRNISNAMFAFKTAPTTPNSLILKNNVIQLYGTIDVCRAQWSNAGALVHENNVFKLGSGSVVNYTLNPSEKIVTGQLFTNTTGNVIDWDFTPLIGGPLVDQGVSVGYTEDFEQNSIVGNPDIGILEVATAEPLSMNISFTPIGYYGGTSTVTVTASGGATPYTGTGTFTRSAGVHEFSVTDDDNATVTDFVTITQPDALGASVITSAISYQGGTSTVNVTAKGGTAPYTFAVDNGSYSSTSTFSLTAGTYALKVKDSTDTVFTQNVTLIEPRFKIAVTYVFRPRKSRKGTITVTANNGLSPYTYCINGGAYQTSSSFTGLSAGTYTITAKDANGLTVSTVYTLRKL